MSAVPKIIIKPRVSASSRSVPPSPQDEEEADVDADAEDEPEDAPTPMEVDGEVANVSEEGGPVVVKRGRGRPRGRGKSMPTSGTSTPRGRGRGRGRPPVKSRGTGRTIVGGGGLTIRLPKRPEEEEEEEDAEGDPGTEGETEEKEKEKEPVAPLGGGKPFRKIQGKVYIIEGDEFVTDEDPKGDEKIDKWGNLLGGLSLSFGLCVLSHFLQDEDSRLQHLFCRDGIQNVAICLQLMRREPLVSETLCTTSEEILLPSNKMLRSPKKTISSRRENLVPICVREALPW
jgi:hypothetical protein